MISLSLEELLDEWSDVEAAVDATPGIDHWCSGPDWAVSVAEGFAPRGKRLLLRSEHGNGYATLGYYRREGIVFLAGIEPLWGFACPIFGSDPEALARELADHLCKREDWSLLALAGLPAHPHPTTKAITAGLRPLGVSIYAEGITRRITDISAGYDNWLTGRSSRFRRNLRQATVRAAEAGLVIENAVEDAATQNEPLLDRLRAVEEHSWKGREGSGIVTPEMSTMYGTMIERLGERGRLQCYVARIAGTDVGYILGGIRNRRYRGLQISFSQHHGDLSIGNLLQNHQLKHLADNDLADTYDMGMDFDYKQRWADRAESSITLILHRSPANRTSEPEAVS